jgi:hypothetical protein
MHGGGDLEARVVRAAEAALADHQYVSAIDVLSRKIFWPNGAETGKLGRRCAEILAEICC